MTQEERLHKVLAHAGVASRRSSEELIKAGRVKVNGEIVTELGTKVIPDMDVLEVDGKLVKTEVGKVYIALNKPQGVVSSAHDPYGRPTVVEIVETAKRVYPVGRLDMDTSGLILLTNDGDLTYHLTHPKHEIDKVYLAKVEGCIPNTCLEELEQGIELEDGPTAPAKCKLLERNKTESVVTITIHEGRNRQVRRMFSTVGYPVQELTRVAIGPLDIKGLNLGSWRNLTKEEVQKLKSM